MTLPTLEEVAAIKQSLVGYWAAHALTFNGTKAVMLCEAYIDQAEEIARLKVTIDGYQRLKQITDGAITDLTIKNEQLVEEYNEIKGQLRDVVHCLQPGSYPRENYCRLYGWGPAEDTKGGNRL